ncbi:hypothetical protein POM88_029701 [Heracleum sosnowskyi]|uniref:Uncharacterized protein n=1 Tax=Heracleum sosnowskyi TaxID=360622 RepID=A0AAD8HV78_9APIA|nr:hypothetical protein POM88_029701 [Heracleum sosnowskyi]
MDFLTPPTEALENLTLTDPLIPPRNNDIKNPTNPSPMLSGEESYRLSLLTALFILWCGPPETCQSYAVDPNIVSAEDRMNQLPLHASKRSSNREKFQRLMYLQRRLIAELSNMAEDKPQHRDKLELAKTYVLGRQKQQVLSIIRSLFTETE